MRGEAQEAEEVRVRPTRVRKTLPDERTARSPVVRDINVSQALKCGNPRLSGRGDGRTGANDKSERDGPQHRRYRSANAPKPQVEALSPRKGAYFFERLADARREPFLGREAPPGIFAL